jgi:hypothetical protein
MTSEIVKNNAHFDIRTLESLGFSYSFFRRRGQGSRLHGTVCRIYVNLMCIMLYFWNVMLNAEVAQLKNRRLELIQRQTTPAHFLLETFPARCHY